MSFDIEKTLSVVEAMAAEMEPYLKGKDLYGMLGFDKPRQTIGGILLRQYQLKGVDLTPEQQSRFQAMVSVFQLHRKNWRVHYEEKLVREVKSRIGNLETFVQEVGESPDRKKDTHPAEATHRTMIAHLAQDAQDLNLEIPDLGVLDRRLKPIFKGDGAFIWEDELQPLYPSDQYWWLYSG